MKKSIKIVALVIGALLLIMFILPFVFKGKIKEQLQKEINSNLNAKVTFSGVGLSLFSHFPYMTLNLERLNIVGINEFSSDTLANISSVSLTLNLMSVIKGKEYEIKQVLLDSPKILLKVLQNGKVNWDIARSVDTAEVTSTPSAFKIKLDKIKISRGEIIYDDSETPMYLSMIGLAGQLGGDMAADITHLNMDAVVNSVTAKYDGIKYLNNTEMQFRTSLDADLSKWIFTFKDARLKLNALELSADGLFAMPEDDYEMDIKFAARENSFKSFLSLIPALYSKDFSSVKTEGRLAFNGFVKGKYTDMLIPSFGINLSISNGMFIYPSLPGKVSNINVTASIMNPDGEADHTIVEVPTLQMQVMQNPINSSFTLKTPISDPEIKGSINGVLNFSDIAKVYPLDEKTILTGKMKADIVLNGKMSSISKGRYEQFQASGYADIDNLSYSSPDIPQALKISKAHLDFSPAFITLSESKINIGKNDISAFGTIENYLPYFLKDNEVLKGSLTTTSSFMDLNSLVSGSTSSGDAQDTSALTIVMIPANIEFVLNSRFERLIYDTYNMQKATGTMRVRDKTLFFDGIRLEMLGGALSLNGSYNTINPGKPAVDIAVKIIEMDVKEAFRTFNTVQTFAPIAAKLSGKLTTDLAFKGTLKQDMMPELSSLSGAGLVLSDILAVENINTFNTIADVLKIEKLRKPALEKINLSFDLLDGKATVKPMDFKLASYKSNFSGTIGLDKVINFVLNLEIPRSDFGGKANNVLSSLVSDASRKGLKVDLGEMVPVTLLIGGSITDPKISAGIKQAMAGVVADLKQQAIEQVQAKKEEVLTKARDEANKLIEQADAQAAKIISLAQQQSDQVLKSAKVAADKVRSQADSTSNKLLKEGKKNGMLAEMAAKKTAEKFRKEAGLKADKILDEAQVKSESILSKARSESEQIKQQARNRVK